MSRARDSALQCRNAATAIGRAAACVGARWQAHMRRRVHRQAIASLQALDDRMLADLGIDRSEIESVVAGRDSDPTRRPRA